MEKKRTVRINRAHKAEVRMSCITEFNKEVYEMDLRDEGLAEGHRKGRLETLVMNITNLMKSLNLSFDEACKALKVIGEDYEYVKEVLKDKSI